MATRWLQAVWMVVILVVFGSACSTSTPLGSAGPAPTPSIADDPLPLADQNRDPGESLVLAGHTDAVSDLAQLTDGRLVSTSWDESIRIWDLDDPSNPIVLDQPDKVHSVAALPDGRFITGHADAVLRVWNPKDLERPRVIQLASHLNYVADIYQVEYLGDERVAVIADSTSVHIVDLGTGSVDQLVGFFDYAMSLARLPDGSIAAGSTLNEIDYYPVDDRERWAFEDTFEPTRIQDIFTGPTDWGDVSLAALPDGRLVHGSAFGLLRVLDPESPDQFTDLGALAVDIPFDSAWDEPSSYTLAHDGTVSAIAVSPLGLVVSGGSDRVARVFNPDLPSSPVELVGHRDWIIAATFLSDGRVATAGLDNTIRVWSFDHRQLAGLAETTDAAA